MQGGAIKLLKLKSKDNVHIMTEWQESEFHSFDGIKLAFRYQEPELPTDQTLILLHRGHEHSARMMPLADSLSEGSYWCFAFDLRGHGKSAGKRAWAPDFAAWVKDLNSFIGHIHQQFGLSQNDMVLIANSVSSMMAVNWVLSYGGNIRGCILAAPAFSIKLYIPLALPILTLVSKFSTQQFVTSYVRSHLLTRDVEAAKAYDTDPLITRKIGVNVLVTLFATAKANFKRLADFDVPVLIFTAENDYIVHNKKHVEFFQKISSKIKKHIVLPSFRHAVFFELEQEKIIAPSKDFIQDVFDIKQLPAVIPVARPHTQQEFQQLQQHGSKFKQFYYAVFRGLLTRLGKHGNGIAIGLKNGFDSGVSLDYVYQNTPSGDNFFGRLVDRVYLNSVGWKGIRARKQHIKQVLQLVTQQLQDNHQKPIIFDVAAGAGRYLFETQQECSMPMQLILNDLDPKSVQKAKEVAKELKADDVDFMNYDAFGLSDSSIVEKLAIKPNVLVVSGLFELYENNHAVHQALLRLAAMSPKGTYLIYTGQPWHPQLEMIARLLNNRNGHRWIMRRRVQQEMDQLVAAAGFTKLSTITDDVGIFTVSCAIKEFDDKVGAETGA